MKSIIMPLPEHVQKKTKNDSQNYRDHSEVKETIAEEIIEKVKNRKFTASDLWNRHSRMRSASTMMRKWNLN